MKQVVVMDLLCMVPYYDRYLVGALMEKGLPVKLASISFHRDLALFKSNQINNDPGLFDLVSKMRIKLTSLRRFFKGMEYVFNLLYYAIRFIFKKPDILHVQWLPLVQRSSLEIIFLKWVKYLEINIVYTVHNIFPHDMKTGHTKKYKKLYSLADALISHTRETKEKLRTIFSIQSEKIWIIPHGAMFHDHERINPKGARRILKLKENDVVVLYFGLIRPYKGIEFLLNTWKRVADKYQGAKLILAGRGSQKYVDRLRQMISELELGKSVICHFGFIPTEQLPIYHQAANILVYPYKEISQSGALLTGMSFGKAILATKTGGFEETLADEQDALLVQYGDEDKLGEALSRLIADQNLREKLGSAVLVKQKSHYSWSRVAELTVCCYRDIVGNDEKIY